MADGEHLQSEQDAAGKQLQKKPWRTRFWYSFSGWSARHAGVDDYLLPVIIGISEIIVYPVFMASGHLEVVGGWLVIKTAGQWGKWAQSRTAFNRFLVGNLSVLAVSYWLTRFINVAKP